MTGRYRDEIDGLRAISVLAVILFHMGFESFRGGFLGVDVFFVISGYLITGILLADPKNLKDFYIKRIRRIMPPMLLVVGVSMAVAAYLFLSSDLFSVSKQAIAALLSLSNVYTLYASAGYWSEAAEQMLFLHLWSLSLEEQFYLLFPFVVLIFRNRQQLLGKFVLLGLIISFCVCVYFTYSHPSAAFYLLPTRAWELLAGAYCAINFKNVYGQRTSTLLSGIGLTLVLVSIFFLGEKNFPGWKPILPVLGTCLLLVGGLQRSNPLNKLLSIAPAKWIGKLSYSLYLWHWPVIIFSNYLKNIYQVEHHVWPLIIIIFALATASYYLVEKPLRYGKHWKVAIAGAFALTMSCSTYIYIKRDKQDEATEYVCTWDGMKYSCIQNTPAMMNTIKTRMKGIKVNYPNSESSDLQKSGITFDYSNKEKDKTRMIVFGDSHALMWSELLRDIAQNLKYEITFFCADGTPIFFGSDQSLRGQFTSSQKKEFDDSRKHALDSMTERDVLVLSSRWDSTLGNIELLKSFYKSLPVNIRKVLIIQQPPVLSFGDTNALNVVKKMTVFNNYIEYVMINKSWMNEHISAKNKDLALDILRNKEVYFFDAYNTDSSKTDIKIRSNNIIYYIDDDHLSTEGAKYFGLDMEKLIYGMK